MKPIILEKYQNYESTTDCFGTPYYVLEVTVLSPKDISYFTNRGWWIKNLEYDIPGITKPKRYHIFMEEIKYVLLLPLIFCIYMVAKGLKLITQ